MREWRDKIENKGTELSNDLDKIREAYGTHEQLKDKQNKKFVEK